VGVCRTGVVLKYVLPVEKMVQKLVILFYKFGCVHAGQEVIVQ
jgi:hypothetical protein